MPYSFEIIRDMSPLNPREEYDHAFTLCFVENRYITGDTTISPYFEPDHESRIIFPVYAYIHSGIALSTAPFSCPWDSGRIGYASIKKADFLREFYGEKARHLTKKRRARALEILKGELEEFQAYLDGDVFGYVIRDEEGEEIESCFGYYGEQYAEEEARAIVDHLNHQQKEQAA